MLPACGLKGAYQPLTPAQRRVMLLQLLLLLLLLGCRQRLFYGARCPGDADAAADRAGCWEWSSNRPVCALRQHGGACQSPGQVPRIRRKSSNRLRATAYASLLRLKYLMPNSWPLPGGQAVTSAAPSTSGSTAQRSFHHLRRFCHLHALPQLLRLRTPGTSAKRSVAGAFGCSARKKYSTRTTCSACLPVLSYGQRRARSRRRATRPCARRCARRCLRPAARR